MAEFLLENAANIIIIAVLAAAIVFAAIKIIRDKRNGKGCGGNCADCGKSCSTKSKRK